MCFDSPSKRLVARAWIQNSHCGALFQSSRGSAFLDVRQSFRKHYEVEMWAVIFNRLPWFQSKNSRCWSIEKSLVVLSLLRPSEYDIGRTEWHENQQCLKYWGMHKLPYYKETAVNMWKEGLHVCRNNTFLSLFYKEKYCARQWLDFTWTSLTILSEGGASSCEKAETQPIFED